MPPISVNSSNNENEYRLSRAKLQQNNLLQQQQQQQQQLQQQQNNLSSDPKVISYSLNTSQLAHNSLTSSSQGPMETSTQEENIPPNHHAFATSTTTTSKITTEINNNRNTSKFTTTKQSSKTKLTRQYLGDVSNQYQTTISQSQQQSLQQQQQQQQQQQSQQQQQLQQSTNQQKKRKPFGGDFNPLNKSITSTKSIPIASDSKHKENLLVPSRLPQKRQATESSTNLVEKLKIQPNPHHHNLANSTSVVSSNQITNNVENNNSTLNNLNLTHKKSKLIDYEWQDLDEEDHDDPLMASEYVNEIFSYFYELEIRMLPDSKYLFKQKNLKPKMRSILVDWLVEMHLKFRLLPESLFLAINIMDRFMSIEIVQIDKLQLLATGSLFIAAKYEEVFSPSIKNYSFFTDGSYTEEEILQAEKYILTILNFDLNYPNPMNFLRRISKADDYDVQSRTLGKYLLEITIIDYKFIGIKPSLCCASAMYLSRLILGKKPVWNGNLIHYSGGYRIKDMKNVIELIYQYLLSPIEHDEFFKKYSMRKFMKSSILCRNWSKKFQFEGKDLFDEKLSTHRLMIEEDDE
ncbi:CLB2 [Candida pseudojiufengensis]|uniref:CLB2 n=1 Tax=Candida pseudojiufengensis TaxID=497109 RepID=UPI0022247194|nr:CLB2 [Candida pseudojiufengensis]KAI5960666.1 CLB2 [Candida pseudojiufengensis]